MRLHVGRVCVFVCDICIFQSIDVCIYERYSILVAMCVCVCVYVCESLFFVSHTHSHTRMPTPSH